MRIWLFASSVAVPLIAIGHEGKPGTLAVALADQVNVEPESVPVADPATCMLPMHVALNVPDPDVPVKDVTAH
jgi:hypothetical protein